jgi:hypothetical protein
MRFVFQILFVGSVVAQPTHATTSTYKCSSGTVRTLSTAGAYNTLVQKALDDSVHTNPIGGLTNPLVDGGTADCYDCYAQFYNALHGYFGTGGSAACAADSQSSECKDSSMMLTALEAFKQCTGGFGLMFDGDACTKAQVTQVEQLVPMPYYTFSHCAYNPTALFCASVDGYITQVLYASSSTCMHCYQEFFRTVLGYAEYPETSYIVSVCTGKDGVWSKLCVASQGEALTAFKNCSGYSMVTTQAIATSTTTTTTTTTTSTVEPLDTSSFEPLTTKAGFRKSSFLVFLLAALILLLL